MQKTGVTRVTRDEEVYLRGGGGRVRDCGSKER